MRILVAPSSFKESLASPQVAKNIRIGLRKASKKFDIVELPLADGGTGTCAVLTNAYHGRFVTRRVCGPVGKTVTARYGWISQKHLAVIELAQAAGLHLVPKKQRNPCKTTTRGVGQLILDAARKRCTRIILGVGDSATIDCGVGALAALGVRFLDKNDNEISYDCRGLLCLKRIDCAYCSADINALDITVATDVSNVLTGGKGALVYARQKGATTKMIPLINKGLRNLKWVVKKQYNIDVDTIPGAGAAGGIPAAFCAVFNSDIQPGFRLAADAIGLEKKMRESDVIITGEGQIDRQNRWGKVVGGVMEYARTYHKPVIIIAGRIAKNALPFARYGVIAHYSLTSRRVSVKSAMTNAPVLLQDVAYKAGQFLKVMTLS